MSTAVTKAPKVLLEWTGDGDADRLISNDPNALMIGFCLDQQITVEAAFLGPLKIRSRVGTLDPGKIAAMDLSRLIEAFRTPPAVHRYPASMAKRVQELCRVIADEYAGDASRIWREAQTGKEMMKRFSDLPGFGAMKARTLVAVAGKHYGTQPPGWPEVAPTWPTLGDVRTVDERVEYQTQKRAFKASLRATAGGGNARQKPGAGKTRKAKQT